MDGGSSYVYYVGVCVTLLSPCIDLLIRDEAAQSGKGKNQRQTVRENPPPVAT